MISEINIEQSVQPQELSLKNTLLFADSSSKYPHHKTVYEKLAFFLKTKKIPNIIFHGPFKSGKKRILNEFLQEIYNNDKQHLKVNVMNVNCCHGKGIKFVREELKNFAKVNIQQQPNVSSILFKSVILQNADCLTIEAQSALRRCIELFTHNTRFFLVIEKKHKLLQPILSRFCDIYICPNLCLFSTAEYSTNFFHFSSTLDPALDASSPPQQQEKLSDFTERASEATYEAKYKQPNRVPFLTGDDLPNEDSDFYQSLKLNDYYTFVDEVTKERKINIRLISDINEKQNQYEDEKQQRILDFFEYMRINDADKKTIIEKCTEYYNFGISALDLSHEVKFIKYISPIKKNELQTFFYRIKGVHRCEKMIIFVFLYTMNDLLHGRELTYDTNFQIYK